MRKHAAPSQRTFHYHKEASNIMLLPRMPLELRYGRRRTACDSEVSQDPTGGFRDTIRLTVVPLHRMGRAVTFRRIRSLTGSSGRRKFCCQSEFLAALWACVVFDV